MTWTPHIRTADVALTLARGVIAHVIVAGQAPAMLWDGELRAYCHAAPVLRLDHELRLPHLGRTLLPGIYTLDASLEGLIPTSLPAQVHAGDQIRVRRVPQSVRLQVEARAVQERVEAWTAGRCGKVAYNLAGLFGFLPRFIFGVLPRHAQAGMLSVVCSQESSLCVEDAYRGAVDPETGRAYDPVPWRAAKWTAPTHLAHIDARLENIARPDGTSLWYLEKQHFAA